MSQLFDDVIDRLIAQQSKLKAFRRDLARGHILSALECVELHELIEMANEIYSEQYAQAEIATHYTKQPEHEDKQ